MEHRDLLCECNFRDYISTWHHLTAYLCSRMRTRLLWSTVGAYGDFILNQRPQRKISIYENTHVRVNKAFEFNLLQLPCLLIALLGSSKIKLAGRWTSLQRDVKPRVGASLNEPLVANRAELRSVWDDCFWEISCRNAPSSPARCLRSRALCAKKPKNIFK